MSPDKEEKQKAPKRYLEEAARLRITLERNYRDYIFAQKDKIVYIFDADIVHFFLNPYKNKGYVEIFSGDHFDEGELVQRALITAEFLFSQRLIGQHDSPPILLPGHADDVFSFISHMEQYLEIVPNEKIIKKIQEDIDIILSGCKNTEILEDKLEIIRCKLPDIFNLLPVREAHEFDRMMTESLIRPAQSHPCFHENIMDLAPYRESVGRWCERIAAAKSHVHSKGSKNRASIRNDARSLIQTILLNEQKETNELFLLVTGDKGVEHAFTKWYYNQNNPPKFPYFLRHPSQYIPELNFNEMPNEIKTQDFFFKTRDALDNLLKNIKKEDSDYPDSLANYYLDYYKRKNGFTDGLIQSLSGNDHQLSFFKDELNDIKKNWNYQTKNAGMLNPELLFKRDLIQKDLILLEGLSDFLKGKDVKEALEDYQNELLVKFSAGYLSIAVVTHLVDMIRDAKKLMRKNCQLESARSPLAIKVSFPSILSKDESLNDFLDDLVSPDFVKSPDIYNKVEEIHNKIKMAPGWHAMCFAACLAMRSGFYSAARYYSDKALKLIPEDSTLHENHEQVEFEIKYLSAVVTKLSSTDEDEFNKTWNNHDIYIKYYENNNDKIKLIRAKTEKATLGLVWCYRDRLIKPFFSTVNKLDILREQGKLFSEAYTQLIEYLKDQNLSKEDSFDTEFTNIICMQVFNNYLSLFLYEKHVEEIEPNLEPDEIDNVANYLKKTLSELDERRKPYVVDFELMMFEWTIENNKQLKLNIGQQYQTKFESLQKMEKNLPDFDIAELNHFYRIIKKFENNSN